MRGNEFWTVGSGTVILWCGVSLVSVGRVRARFIVLGLKRRVDRREEKRREEKTPTVVEVRPEGLIVCMDDGSIDEYLSFL